MAEEFFIPRIEDRPIPDRDGSNYDDTWLMPTWDQLLDLIEEEELERCDLVVIGKVYRGSQLVGGATWHVDDTEDLYRVPESDENIDNPFNTPMFVERLFGWWGNPPSHVSHFIVKRI